MVQLYQSPGVCGVSTVGWLLLPPFIHTHTRTYTHTHTHTQTWGPSSRFASVPLVDGQVWFATLAVNDKEEGEEMMKKGVCVCVCACVIIHMPSFPSLHSFTQTHTHTHRNHHTHLLAHQIHTHTHTHTHTPPHPPPRSLHARKGQVAFPHPRSPAENRPPHHHM
jgi:hypothetical protein